MDLALLTRHRIFPAGLNASFVRRVVLSCLLVTSLLPAAPAARAEKVEQLKPQGYVNDFAAALDEQSKEKLTALCGEVDQRAHAQIAIVTVRSLDGAPIEDFAVNLATRWGIGPKGSSRGVLILLVPSEHKYRIEVGYGLEPILPDGKVGGFGREAAPLLRAGNYGGALLLMTQRIAAVIAQDAGVTLTATPAEPESLPRTRLPYRRTERVFKLIFFLVIALVALVRWLFSLLFPGIRRRRWYGGPWIMGGWGGGGFGGGGGGGGGGGFGGFGGGSFGGGGASGSW